MVYSILPVAIKTELLNQSSNPQQIKLLILSFQLTCLKFQKTHNAKMKLEYVENDIGPTVDDKLDQFDKSRNKTKFGQPDTIRSMHNTLFKRWDLFEKNIDYSKDEKKKQFATYQRRDTKKKDRAKLSGVGQILEDLRMQHRPSPKEHIVLDGLGLRYRDPFKFPISRMHEVQTKLIARDGEELPEMEMPADIRVARKMIRQKMIRCKKCKTRFLEKNLYKRHLRDKHPKLYDLFIEQQSEECEAQKQAERDHQLFDEMKTGSFIPPLCSGIGYGHSPLRARFSCKECLKRFLTPRKLRKHMKMSHVFTTTYQCHFCDELFINETARYTHERIHTGIIKFECQICDYRANRYSDMEEHNLNEHGYVCPICQHKTMIQASEDSISYIESPRLWMLFKGE
ncbi:hypothetical protein L5515_016748 [Caenorhabditis briggsae]|uniref:C2H2-type domain-containing protein n=1 Tax=Caenorhabditis briggsae TaxID=6238 RepID=A0AAE9JRQ8_CAEBR|nr:hypothetical protein L5515_016748 [Caenorhabditis briggsae]